MREDLKFGENHEQPPIQETQAFQALPDLIRQSYEVGKPAIPNEHSFTLQEPILSSESVEDLTTLLQSKATELGEDFPYSNQEIQLAVEQWATDHLLYLVAVQEHKGAPVDEQYLRPFAELETRFDLLYKNFFRSPKVGVNSIAFASLGGLLKYAREALEGLLHDTPSPELKSFMQDIMSRSNLTPIQKMWEISGWAMEKHDHYLANELKLFHNLRDIIRDMEKIDWDAVNRVEEQ